MIEPTTFVTLPDKSLSYADIVIYQRYRGMTDGTPTFTLRVHQDGRYEVVDGEPNQVYYNAIAASKPQWGRFITPFLDTDTPTGHRVALLLQRHGVVVKRKTFYNRPEFHDGGIITNATAPLSSR